MNEVALRVAEMFLVVVFFGIGVFCAQLSLRVDLNELRGKQRWWLVVCWWYGVAFMVTVVCVVYLALVVLLALRLN